MNAYRLTQKLMGSKFEFLLHHEDRMEAEMILNKGVAEVQRIENLLTEFKPDSLTSALNRNAGGDFTYVGKEVFELIKRCIHVSEISQGAFDITVGALKKLYSFKNTDFAMPVKPAIKDALLNSGFKHLEMDEGQYSVRLKKKQMSLSFAAVGKGYAADQVKKVWLESGVESAVISASGDISTIGSNSYGLPWEIGIADPDDPESTLFYIPVWNACLATSGDYMQYMLNKGKRYSHTINPVSGLPVPGIKSVTVVSPAAELSDALATAVSVMGVENGMFLIEQLPDTHCILIDHKDQRFFSNKIHLLNEV